MTEKKNIVVSIPPHYALGAFAMASVGAYVITKMIYTSVKTFVESRKLAKNEKINFDNQPGQQ